MPRHWIAALRTLVMVMAVSVFLSASREWPRFDAGVVIHGVVQAALVLAIATPVAGLVYLLSGGDEQSGVRAARLWAIVSVIVLLLVQLAGFTLLSRFAAPVEGQ